MKNIIERIELTDLKKLNYSESLGYFGHPDRFESIGLYLFQSLDLIVVKNSISEINSYYGLSDQSGTSNKTRPEFPKLTNLGEIMTCIIIDKPLSEWLKRSVAIY
jgi:hypothetical protein